jgi:DNA replication protein DnaC
MLTNDTMRKLNELKLFGMARGFDNQLSSAAAAHLAFEERLGLLVDQEVTYRENRRLKRLLQVAKLRESACMEDIDYRAGRGLDRSEMASLGQCNWVRHGINMIITGATGGGKTWLGCALGNQACRQGLTVTFQRLPLLLEELAISHGDGSFCVSVVPVPS